MSGPDQPFRNPGGEQDPQWANPSAPGGPQAPWNYPGYPQGSPPPPYGYPPPGGPGGYAGPPQPWYPDPYDPYRAVAPTGTNPLAIASLVTSIMGFPLLFVCYIGIGGWIAGIVLGIVALGQIKQTRQNGSGLAVAGIAVGAAALLLTVIGLIVFFGMVAASA